VTTKTQKPLDIVIPCFVRNHLLSIAIKTAAFSARVSKYVDAYIHVIVAGGQEEANAISRRFQYDPFIRVSRVPATRRKLVPCSNLGAVEARQLDRNLCLSSQFAIFSSSTVTHLTRTFRNKIEDSNGILVAGTWGETPEPGLFPVMLIGLPILQQFDSVPLLFPSYCNDFARSELVRNSSQVYLDSKKTIEYTGNEGEKLLPDSMVNLFTRYRKQDKELYEYRKKAGYCYTKGEK